MTSQEPFETFATRLYSRRRVVKTAALGSASLLGLAALAAVPQVAEADDRPFHKHRDDKADLHDAMRKLWEDHIVWTRGFIVSFVAGLPDLDATTQRLLQNQVDIGNALVPFVGQDAGTNLTALLTDHILGAARLLAAAKAGDTDEVNRASADWYANGNDIAAFLAGLNPRGWPLADMQDMMRQHLDLTLAEAVAQLTGDWAGSIAAYDQVHVEILQMSDMLSDGLPVRGRH